MCPLLFLVLANLLFAATDPSAAIRGKLAAGDLPSAEAILEDYKRDAGETPAYWKGAGWLARGAFQQRDFVEARRWSNLALAGAEKALGNRRMDQEPDLELAIGAALEVEGQTLAAQGKRKDAEGFFKSHLELYRGTPVEKRLRKNWNALALTGQPAPPIAGKQPKAALIFLWAHYCGDCKAQAAILLRLSERFKRDGLTLIAPTQLYGSVDDKSAEPAEESAFIEKTWRETYGAGESVSHPIDPEAMLAYGASTTPTLVLTDRNGVVRLYRPGRLTVAQLERSIRSALESGPASNNR